MHKLWLILAVILGALAAGVIGLWPVAPLWTAQTETRGRIESFSSDGTTLVSTHLPVETDKAPYVCHWDVGTGALRARVELVGVRKPQHGGLVLMMDDQKHVLAGLFTAPRAGPGAPPAPEEWTLHDAATGERKLGPPRDLAGLDPACSSDGRWLCFVQPGALERPMQDLEVRSKATNEAILKIAGQDDQIPGTYRFAPDGSSLAVLWRPALEGRAADVWSVSIFDLATAVERKRFDLSTDFDQWQLRIFEWDGRSLVLWSFSTQPMPGRANARAYQFDTAQEPVGQGALAAVFQAQATAFPDYGLADMGSDWLAYRQLFRPGQEAGAWYEQGRDWFLDLFRARAAVLTPRSLVQLRSRQSGDLRYTLLVPVGGPYRFSPDGRRLATRFASGGIAVWDLDPWPRWPWMVLAGFTPSVLVLLYRRWRIQRIRRTLSWEVEG